jgi:hypothetical protein
MKWRLCPFFADAHRVQITFMRRAGENLRKNSALSSELDQGVHIASALEGAGLLPEWGTIVR